MLQPIFPRPSRGHDLVQRSLRYEIGERTNRLPPEESEDVEIEHLVQRLQVLPR